MVHTVIYHVTIQALHNIFMYVTGPEGHPAYCKWLQGFFVVGSGQVLALATHLHPAQRLKRGWSYSSSSLCAFMVG